MREYLYFYFALPRLLYNCFYNYFLYRFIYYKNTLRRNRLRLFFAFVLAPAISTRQGTPSPLFFAFPLGRPSGS
jgi:hypothetical protein